MKAFLTLVKSCEETYYFGQNDLIIVDHKSLAMDKALVQRTDGGVFSGSVLVQNHGAITLDRKYGFADKKKFRPSYIYSAPVSKQFIVKTRPRISYLSKPLVAN